MEKQKKLTKRQLEQLHRLIGNLKSWENRVQLPPTQESYVATAKSRLLDVLQFVEDSQEAKPQ